MDKQRNKFKLNSMTITHHMYYDQFIFPKMYLLEIDVITVIIMNTIIILI